MRLDLEAAEQVLYDASSSNPDLVQAARIHLEGLSRMGPAYRDLLYFTQAVRALDRLIEDPETGLPALIKTALRRLHNARGATEEPTLDPATAGLLRLSELFQHRPGEAPRDRLARFLDASSPVLHPGSGPLSDRPDGLTLTTVDAARGREWRVVFVIDAGDHVIPGAVGPSDPERWEGQQRIFYMLSTRASGLLYFCCPRQEGRGFDARHSRFLDPASEWPAHERGP